MAKKRRPRTPIASTTAGSEDVTAFVEEETSLVPVQSGTTSGPTDIVTATSATAATTSGETTGRTWADVVQPYSSNERYLYLIVFLVIALAFATTGNLKSVPEAVVAGGVTVIAWIVLYLIQRRP